MFSALTVAYCAAIFTKYAQWNIVTHSLNPQFVRGVLILYDLFPCAFSKTMCLMRERDEFEREGKNICASCAEFRLQRGGDLILCQFSMKLSSCTGINAWAKELSAYFKLTNSR
jgi:hypothetical protein